MAMSERKLKILHVTTAIDVGGAESMLANVVEAMTGAGHEVVVATLRADGLAEGDKVAVRIAEGATRFVDLNASTVLDVGALWKLIRLIREERPDVVQTWMHHADLLGGVATKLAMSGAKLVWGIHSRAIFSLEGANRLKVAGMKRAMILASRFLPDRIVSCSKTAVADHVGYGYPAAKMVWICNGIVTGRFGQDPEWGKEMRASLGIPQHAPVVGYVGRFVPVKDMGTFFRAAAILQEEREDVHFVCCGGTLDSAGADVRAAVAALGSPERLHVLGARGDVERVYPMFSVCSLTSVSEAFPMVLLEAMASGVPCVSTDVGDAKCIIESTGRVVPVGEPEEVAAAWRAMIEIESPEWDAFGAAAKKRCEEEFSLERSVREYGELYEQLCA